MSKFRNFMATVLGLAAPEGKDNFTAEDTARQLARREILKQFAELAGGHDPAARMLGMSQAALSQMLHGQLRITTLRFDEIETSLETLLAARRSL